MQFSRKQSQSLDRFKKLRRLLPLSIHCMCMCVCVLFEVQWKSTRAPRIVDYNRQWLQHLNADFWCTTMKFNGFSLAPKSSQMHTHSNSLTYTILLKKLRNNSKNPGICECIWSGNWQRKTINYWAIKLFSTIWNDAMHLCCACIVSIIFSCALRSVVPAISNALADTKVSEHHCCWVADAAVALLLKQSFVDGSFNSARRKMIWNKNRRTKS